MFNKKYIFGAILVSFVSVVYNYLSFLIIGVYPDFVFSLPLFDSFKINFFLYIVVKNFIVGFVLMFLFDRASFHMERDNEYNEHLIKGIFFYSAYAIFALFAFSIADLFLMQSNEGLLLLFTVNGFVESIIVTIPIKLLQPK